MEVEQKGRIYRVAGPVVTVTGIEAKMYDLVKVGDEGLLGEVIEIDRDKFIIQVYEDTSGIKPGEPVQNTGLPLSVELGPGLLGSIYDGIQRPLPVLNAKLGDFIERGVAASGLDHSKKWDFVPEVKKGDEVRAGQSLGYVQETANLKHKIMVPPDKGGRIETIEAGEHTIDDVVCTLDDGTQLKLMQEWPVRVSRPSVEKLMPDIPLVTGQRILDALFPVAKGGTAAIPGPFGSGKTVAQQQLAKWSDTQIVVYIGCGERGNEMADVLTEFPELEDPQTNAPLMDRTVLVANTSNMPVAAREASVYTGLTIAEYFRDMGYDVSLMADSTSRWAEAMREISSRLEEMPGEEGYPAYLAARLSEFYERAGRVKTLGGDEGSITVIGAVSPPGGDFSEPVTQNTLRIVKVFWALDSKLSQQRHFPSINWLDSYSLYTQNLAEWFSGHVTGDWEDLRMRAMAILQKESELQEVVQLVGSDALPDDEQLTLEVARMIREYFLQQNAYHEVDTYCPLQKQHDMLAAILVYDDLARKALNMGKLVDEIINAPAKAELAQIKFQEEYTARLEEIETAMRAELA
ncbi:MAG TPA: V-type ATP synthase subunit A [Candidatus Bathyarchaeia archaeon]|nr:V-type ATP synthase subunit A [Candidatus Bathyarchaeia archaeon]